MFKSIKELHRILKKHGVPHEYEACNDGFRVVFYGGKRKHEIGDIAENSMIGGGRHDLMEAYGFGIPHNDVLSNLSVQEALDFLLEKGILKEKIKAQLNGGAA